MRTPNPTKSVFGDRRGQRVAQAGGGAMPVCDFCRLRLGGSCCAASPINRVTHGLLGPPGRHADAARVGWVRGPTGEAGDTRPQEAGAAPLRPAAPLALIHEHSAARVTKRNPPQAIGLEAGWQGGFLVASSRACLLTALVVLLYNVNNKNNK